MIYLPGTNAFYDLDIILGRKYFESIFNHLRDKLINLVT